MTNASYQQKAFEIIRSSVKSAVFIDDKALSFYSQENPQGYYEEELSKSLFNNFKQNGVSLAVHKFQKGDELDDQLKNYLFEERDLVLLDWNLEGNEGTDYSLKMISEVISKPNIHFCVIYTSTPNISEVYNQVSCYFSGKTTQDYDEIREELEAYEDELTPLLESINILDKNSAGRLIPKLKELDPDLLSLIVRITKQNDNVQALINTKFAFSNWFKSDLSLPKPTIISPDSQTLVIHNTVITVLQKDDEKDAVADSSGLIKKLSDQLSNSNDSFTQLLGFEMQSLFSKSSSFIDSNLLKVSKEALLSHRNQMFSRDNEDTSFKVLIKNLLIEHASMSLRNSKLSLLKDDFLAEQSEGMTTPPSNEALLSMNVFYNSIKIKNTISENIKTLNFGDVFLGEDERYYICITPLCDCYRPSKIMNNYYFAIGQTISVEKALKMGDSAFISYLPTGKVVSWVLPDKKDEVKQIQENYDVGSLSEEQKEIAQLKTNIEKLKIEKNSLEQFVFKPVYIKPVQYNVTNHKLVDDKLEITRVETMNGEQDLPIIQLEYITSIRPTYAQRIANHAFTHPLRVGVDFAKKS